MQSINPIYEPINQSATNEQDNANLTVTKYLLKSPHQGTEDVTETFDHPSRRLGRFQYGSLSAQIILAFFPALFIG